MCSKTFTYIFIAALFINNPKLKTSQMSTNEWMNKQIGTYPYNGKLFSNEKEPTIDTYNNMDASLKIIAE